MSHNNHYGVNIHKKKHIVHYTPNWAENSAAKDRAISILQDRPWYKRIVSRIISFLQKYE